MRANSQPFVRWLGDDEEYFSWWAAVQAYNSINARMETLKEPHAQCRQ
ncbi:MAG: hypothetical protein HA496_02700 [Thaumarchaeota archaeon]|jgi:hypothetical protein|nr:hypothetical protein [Nitrososphaerota archaeon]